MSSQQIAKRLPWAEPIGTTYRNRGGLHARYGGQAQGGISTPAHQPFLMLFSTEEEAQKYGYRDGWDEGVYQYTGEGQQGDMTFKAGNRAIRDHAENGKTLHLFHRHRKRDPFVYAGEFSCAGWEYRDGEDIDHNPRSVIVFFLSPRSAEMGETDESVRDEVTGVDLASDLSTLRTRAFDAATMVPQASVSEAKRRNHQRSLAVKRYVLARANGKCESCDQPAPFVRRDGSPYLEPHHTQMVSEGGPDHPRWVAAVCPTCHRRIHHGVDGPSVNARLMGELADKEA